MRELLARLDLGLRWLVDGLLVLLLGAMILLAATQILLRNAFDGGFIWADGSLRMMVLWVALLGAVSASRDDDHIRIDVLSRFLPPLGVRIARIVTDLFTTSVCAAVAYYAWGLVQLSQEFETEVLAGLPEWWFQMILPAGFGLIALRYGVLLVRGLMGERPMPGAAPTAH